MERNNNTQPTSICKDEMNLAEFPLSVIGRRAPKGVKTIEFQDDIVNPKTGERISRHITVTGSDLLGLPTSVDDEVLVGCLKLTKDDGLTRRRVPFTAYQFLEELGWSRDGKGYRRLSKSLDRWKGTMVISNNAFFHKGKQKLVKDTFGLIDRWQIGDSEVTESGKRGWFVWGDFMWESLQAGNIRSLDFGFWKSLESPVAKRLFRLLDKRFYQRRSVQFPLTTLAYEKVGVSRKLHSGQIKESLKIGHRELAEKGFCQSEYVKQGRGECVIVYTDLRCSRSDKLPEAHPLIIELAKREVKNGRELVAKFSASKIRQAIENFDDRRAHGEEIGPGWLGKCIVSETLFSFRKGFESKAKRHKRLAKAAAKRSAEEKKRKASEESARRQEELFNNEFLEFLKRIEREGNLEEYAGEAFAANSMFAKLHVDANASGNVLRASELKRDAMKCHWLRKQKD